MDAATSRGLANRTVTQVVQEKTVTRTKRSFGVPTQVREVECVYTLACGHEAKRTLSFSQPRHESGDRLLCHTCAGGAR